MSKEIQIHFGKWFYKQTTGYYLLREWDKIHKIYHSILAHRWVWENHFGPIPPNMEIHHKDGNRGNNDINNLEMLSKSDHMRLHSQEDSKKAQLDKVRPLQWLKSEEGRKAVSKKGKESWAIREEKEITCEGCGSKAIFKRWARFCSKNCYMKWCHKNQINFIEAICEVCNNTFKKPRSKKVRFCSTKCMILGRKTKNK